MKYLKYFESNDIFTKGDIVYLNVNASLVNEPFEITSVTFGPELEGSKQYNRLSSLIRDYQRNWALNKDLIHLTEKEKEDLKTKMDIIKFNI